MVVTYKSPRITRISAWIFLRLSARSAGENINKKGHR